MLKAGLPLETTAVSVNRQCGSGLQAVNSAVQAIQTEEAEIVVACGTENMDLLPYYLRKHRYGNKMGNDTLEDGVISILTLAAGPISQRRHSRECRRAVSRFAAGPGRVRFIQPAQG